MLNELLSWRENEAQQCHNAHAFYEHWGGATAGQINARDNDDKTLHNNSRHVEGPCGVDTT
jgi:hypothetical protein